MRRNHLKKVLAVFVAVSMMLLVFNPAVLAEGKDTKHGYGYRPATAAETKEYNKHATHAKYVLPNKLAIQRINEARQNTGLEPLPESLGVPAGQEMLAEKAKLTKAQGITLKAIDQIYGADPMPAMVDNSESIAFPPISDQGTVGSCAAFASTYYMATYERAKALNLNAKDNTENQLSPKFTYNLINGAKDEGSSIQGNIDSIYNTGALTMTEFPYDSNFTAWPTRPELWRTAMSRESITDDGSFPVDFPEGMMGEPFSGLTLLKSAVLDGKVLAFGTYIEHWNVSTVDDNPDDTVTDDHQGEYIATSMNKVDYENAKDGHAMTAVGYDDNIWVDMDSDDVVDANEKGAIKVANSWGTTGWDNNGGFIWVSYEALKDYYYNDPYGTDLSHPSIFDGGWAYYMTFSNKPYTPDLTAEINLTTNDRYQLTALTGFNWSEADEPCSDIDYGIEDYFRNYYDFDWNLSENAEGAAVSLDGTTENHAGTIVIDLSRSFDEWKDKGGALTYCIGIEDSAKAGGHTINSIQFKDEKAGVTFDADGLATPYTADSNTGNHMKWFTKKYIADPSADLEPYQDMSGLPALQLNVPITKTYHDGDDYSWRFTPVVTGKYKIVQSKPEIEIGVENEARNPLLLQNDPSGNGNIAATLYAGRTYVIDANYEEYSDDGGDDGEDYDAGNMGSVFPVTANISISLVSTATASSASADVTKIVSTSPNALSPIFSAGVYSYSLKATSKDTTITATLADTDAYATIDGKVGTSKTISLNPDGNKLVRVDVFAKDWSKSKTYNIFVYRPKSTDATLSTLGIGAGTWWLNKIFAPATTSYTLTLGEYQESITLTPLTSDENARFTFGRESVPSKTINLLNGQHTSVSIKVTPQTGKSKTYSITIQRAKSTNSDLADLKATFGTWDSTFSASDLEYKLTLGEFEKTTKITAFKVPYSSVSPASKTVSLDTGKKTTVIFKVRPQSGPAKIYKVYVERANSTDATLKSLKGVALTPGFKADMMNYTATVPAKTKSVTLSPTVNNKYAKVAYFDNKTGLPCTKKITLTNPGDSFEVEVRVTAQDGSVKHYYITITRNLV